MLFGKVTTSELTLELTFVWPYPQQRSGDSVTLHGRHGSLKHWIYKTHIVNLIWTSGNAALRAVF